MTTMATRPSLTPEPLSTQTVALPSGPEAPRMHAGRLSPSSTGPGRRSVPNATTMSC